MESAYQKLESCPVTLCYSFPRTLHALNRYLLTQKSEHSHNTNFQDAIYDSDTQFPENFDPIAAGAIFSEEPLGDCPAPSTN
jgi:hypothetical protein